MELHGGERDVRCPVCQLLAEDAAAVIWEEAGWACVLPAEHCAGLRGHVVVARRTHTPELPGLTAPFDSVLNDLIRKLARALAVALDAPGVTVSFGIGSGRTGPPSLTGLPSGLGEHAMVQVFPRYPDDGWEGGAWQPYIAEERAWVAGSLKRTLRALPADVELER